MTSVAKRGYRVSSELAAIQFIKPKQYACTAQTLKQRSKPGILMMNHRRKLLTLEILPLLLTAVIAIAAALSAYFSYKVAVIASIQENREQRQ